MGKIWDKETSPLMLHDAFCVDAYPPMSSSDDPQERSAILLERQEVTLRQVNLNLARLNELQDNTNKAVNILVGVGVFIGIMVFFG